MAKSKAGSVPNRPIYSRISYLYQAATYLEISQASQRTQSSTGGETKHVTEEGLSTAQHTNLSRHLLTDLRAASLKSQIRLSPDMKRPICKFCDTLLIDGQTSSSVVENKSKGGKKPWADVLVITCHTCQGVKRYPVQAARQKRRPVREKEARETTEKNTDAMDTVKEDG